METYSIENYNEDKRLFHSYIKKFCLHNQFVMHNIKDIKNRCLYDLFMSRKTYNEEKGKYSTYAFRRIKYTILYYYNVNKNDINDLSLDSYTTECETQLIDFVASSENIEKNIIQKQVMQKFWNLIENNKKLNKKNIKIIAYLFFWKGYKYTEIAKKLKCTRQAVKQRLQYIIKFTKDKFSLDDFNTST